jgi:LPXTG-motif cell wall-anchored protein
MRQRTIGNALVSVGLLVMALGLVADRASAHSDTGPNYEDKVTKIEGSSSYDPTADTTTFVFKATFSEQVSHLVVSSCPAGTDVVDATAPSGVKVEKNKTDPGGTDATGAKFEPGKSGTYTVAFTGNVTGAEFIVKNGNGHRHYSIGSGCSGTPVTTSGTAPETSDTSAPETSDTTEPDTSDTTEPETTDTSLPGPSETTTPTTAGSPGTTQPSTTATTGGSGESTSTTDATVLGSQLENTSTSGVGVASDVLGIQQEQSPTGTLPRTGGDVDGYLLLAGLALVLGGLAVRFGQAEPAVS